MAAGRRWTEEELNKALALYRRIPFGQFDQHNPEVMKLAKEVGRTASSVAMKLCNFASLDPEITGTGRKGLDGASKLDRRMWDQFQAL